MLPAFNTHCIGRPIDVDAVVHEAWPHRANLLPQIFDSARRWEEGVDFTQNPDPRSKIAAVEIIGQGLYLRVISDSLPLDMKHVQIAWQEIECLPPYEEDLQTSLNRVDPDMALKRAIERSLRLTWARLWWNEEARQRLAADAMLLPMGVKMLSMGLYFETVQKHAEILCKKLDLPDLQQLSMGFYLGYLSLPWIAPGFNKRPDEIKSLLLEIVTNRLSLSGKITSNENLFPKPSNVATAICMREMNRRSQKIIKKLAPNSNWQVLLDRAMDAQLKTP
jgi:hypothetical protein